MPLYKVIKNPPDTILRHNDVDYPAGSVVDMDSIHARHLLDAGVLSVVPPSKCPACHGSGLAVDVKDEITEVVPLVHVPVRLAEMAVKRPPAQPGKTTKKKPKVGKK